MRPLYVFLLHNNLEFSESVGWNYTKFLCDQEGQVRARFSPHVINLREIEPVLEKL